MDGLPIIHGDTQPGILQHTAKDCGHYENNVDEGNEQIYEE